MKKILATATILFTVYSCKKKYPIPPAQSTNPIITSFSPASGQFNTSITINGNNFNSNPSNNQVSINGKSAFIQAATETTLTVLIPERAGTGPVSVTTASGTATGNNFTYIPTVFVSGNELNGIYYTAKYWKNGIETVLQDRAVVNCIIVNGNDVYAAGSAHNPSVGLSFPTVWKNDSPTMWSTNSLVHGSVLSLFISGSDLYGAGTAIDNSTSFNSALYWKNGAPTVINVANINNVACGIVVLSNDVYVASFTWGNTFNALMWKNNASYPIILNPNSTSSSNALFVSENDIYLAGSEKSGTSLDIAKYWKNGNPVSLSNGINSAIARSIFVTGGDVYVAGSETIGAISIAKYWKNGNPVSLSDGTKNTVATSIQVLGDDVYIAGHETIGTKRLAVFWKNGIKTMLTNGVNDAQATSIFIQ